mmetsp:Transcript_67070/g.212278  ORF Transcript_67070/g.212278 Transcript_67070/m.212278 type:complete len:275 (+) Transcript_67070:373-1197(+)
MTMAQSLTSPRSRGGSGRRGRSSAGSRRGRRRWAHSTERGSSTSPSAGLCTWTWKTSTRSSRCRGRTASGYRTSPTRLSVWSFPGTGCWRIPRRCRRGRGRTLRPRVVTGCRRSSGRPFTISCPRRQSWSCCTGQGICWRPGGSLTASRCYTVRPLLLQYPLWPSSPPAHLKTWPAPLLLTTTPLVLGSRGVRSPLGAARGHEGVAVDPAQRRGALHDLHAYGEGDGQRRSPEDGPGPLLSSLCDGGGRHGQHCPALPLRLDQDAPASQQVRGV